MKRIHAQLALVPTACFLLSSCATMDQMGARHGTAIGCSVGSVMGAVVGNVVGRRLGSQALGTVAGAAVGGLVGCKLGNRWQEHQQALQELAKVEKIRIDTELLSLPVVVNASAQTAPQPAGQAGLVAQVQSQGMFATDSAQFTADGLRQAKALAAIYRNDFSPSTAVKSSSRPVLLVVGHTDATGSAEHNQQLSELRARAMGEVLQEAGIHANQVYYQGAGAARPIAENDDAQGRARNRRVELVELASSDLLMTRVRQEQANPRYLAYGTSTTTGNKDMVGSASKAGRQGRPVTSAPAAAARRPAGTTHGQPATGGNFVDFGGEPAADQSWGLAAYLRPSPAGLSLISSALADTPPMHSCLADRPRVSGAVKSLASGRSIDSYQTREFLPGMNGRAWANVVNGHLVTLSPVAVLKEGAVIPQNPLAYVTRNYSRGDRKPLTMNTEANTYEGADYVLYRVFVRSDREPMSCMDVVLPKAGPMVAPAGKLYYEKSGQVYVADFKPQRG